MRILVAPDKMKGSLSAKEICDIFSMQISFMKPDWEVINLPLADGGEGSLEIVEKYKKSATRVYLDTTDAVGNPVETYYLRDGKEAYIELAKQSGIAQLKLWEHNPFLATTYGTGTVIKDAVSNGARSIHLFLGGSASHDLGLGILSGLGYEFYDRHKKVVSPSGGTLRQIETWAKPDDLPKAKYQVYCDVKNPLVGPQGAAYQFAPQKGANILETEELDRSGRAFLKKLREHFTTELDVPMDGAAGGIPVGLKTFLQAETMAGIDYFLQMTDAVNKVAQSDLIISGEGKIDETSLQNKTINGIGKLAQELDKPLFLFCGYSLLSVEDLKGINVRGLWQLCDEDNPIHQAQQHARSLLTTRIAEFIKKYDSAYSYEMG